MLLSGSIGVIILEKNSKVIYLLSDDHSNSIYCSNKSEKHKDIDDFLKDKLDFGDQILLEEVPRDGFDLKELWPDSPHTQDLKNLFLENKDIIGIDIRPYLIPFSWDVFEIEGVKSQLKDVTIIEYMSKLNDFFKAKGKFFNKVFTPVLKSIKIKNSGLGKNLNDIRNKYFEILNKIKSNDSIYYYFLNRRDILVQIDKICDMIMEFYTLLLAFTNKRISYIHAGLFHSNNILEYLIRDYNFTVKYKYGTILYPTHKKNITSCTVLPNVSDVGIF